MFDAADGREKDRHAQAFKEDEKSEFSPCDLFQNRKVNSANAAPQSDKETHRLRQCKASAASSVESHAAKPAKKSYQLDRSS
jgi:hypothetical protein